MPTGEQNCPETVGLHCSKLSVINTVVKVFIIMELKVFPSQGNLQMKARENHKTHSNELPVSRSSVLNILGKKNSGGKSI